jgi:hypothetical protein
MTAVSRVDTQNIGLQTDLKINATEEVKLTGAMLTGVMMSFVWN